MPKAVAFCGDSAFQKLKYFKAIILRIRHCSLLALCLKGTSVKATENIWHE